MTHEKTMWRCLCHCAGSSWRRDGRSDKLYAVAMLYSMGIDRCKAVRNASSDAADTVQYSGLLVTSQLLCQMVNALRLWRHSHRGAIASFSSNYHIADVCCSVETLYKAETMLGVLGTSYVKQC